MSRILIAVTHLLGAGHLTRAASLARAFAAAGHPVTLVSGGMPAALTRLDGIRLVQLPPVRTTGTAFTRLLDPEGAPVTEERLADRRDALLGAFAESGPDAVITELWPFGRRVLTPEFEALADAVRAASPRPLLLASIRDILARPSRPERIAATEARLAAYDAVLVHGDPDFLPLDASWPVGAGVAARLRYTGYVDEAEAAPVAEGARSGIVVSGGSSAAGLPLQEAAVAAAALTPGLSWRILVGRAVPEPAFARLAEAAPANALVERARPDFRALLAGAALSVSQAGYNTVLDLLQSGCPAVLVPFEAGHETEQRLRADTLAAHGLARVLPEDALTAEALAAAVTTAPPPGFARAIARDGARRSVAIVEGMLDSARRDLCRSGKAPSLHPSLDLAPLTDALARAGDAGRTVDFWWRDDDATAHTPALDRLLALANRSGWPVALAAVPGRAEPSLAARLADEGGIDLLVHGLTHANHAPPELKKAEFGPNRALAARRADAAEALALARSRLGPRLLPVLVPPWNRLAPDLPECLPALSYRGLSAAAPVAAVPGLIQAHAAVDPIAWRAGARLADPAWIIDKAARAVAAGGPVGLLTHHLVQDEATWAFCARLLEGLADQAARGRGARISRAAALFAPAASPMSQPSPIFRGDPGTLAPREDSTASG